MTTKTLLGGPAGQVATALGDYSMGSNRILSLALPVLDDDAANKQYVNDRIRAALAGLAWKEPVRAASVANLALTGLPTIDGIALAADDRVLVKDQTDPTENGLYVAAAGVWSRADDFDDEDSALQAVVPVREGTTQADTIWYSPTDAPITIGFTPITFTLFASLSSLIAGAGLIKTGNTVDVVATDDSILVNPDDLQVKRDPVGAIGLTPAGVKVLVDGVSVLIVGGMLVAPAATASGIFPATNVGFIPILGGQSVALAPGGVVLASATSPAGEVVGLAVAPVLPFMVGSFQMSGAMVQASWAAATGFAALTPGRYYLDLVAGMLTLVPVPPAPGRISQSVGVAVDGGTLTLRLSDPVALA